MRRIESHSQASDGLLLFRRGWIPEKPKRALLFVHGYAEHSGRYDAMASWFAARGAVVFAFDHRGHGRSGGPRCHVDRFEEYLDDLEHQLDLAREASPGLPLSVVGHSMGGLITVALLVDRQPTLSSAITSGATLSLGEGVSGLRMAIARLLRRVVPRFSIGSGLDPEGLSRDPRVVRDYLEDPLIFRTMTASLAAEVLAAVPRVAAGAPRVEVPLLLLHGEADPLCHPSGSRAFHERLDGAQSELRLYPELRHEIFNEPERELVYQDMWNWLERVAA